MASVLLALALVGGLDAGGTVGGTFPLGGLTRHHSSSALLGVQVGYSTGPLRIAADYGYTSLPGLQGNTYRLALHLASLSAGYEFIRGNDWGLEVTGGGGYGLAARDFESGSESGGCGIGRIGLNFVQHVGAGRLSIGLADDVIIEAGSGGTIRVAASQLLSVRAGVCYVF